MKGQTIVSSRDTRIPGLFKRRERGATAKIIILSTLGFPALFVGPFVLGTIYWIIGLMFRFYVPWSWVFGGAVLVLIPLLFRLELRTRGSYLTEALAAAHEESRLPFLLGMSDIGALINFAAHPRTTTAGLVTLFLWGPAQMLEAMETFRRTRHVRRVDRDRAADVLATLHRRGVGVSVDDLAKAIGSSTELFNVLAYLLVYDWIGVSTDSSRVWIGSRSREILQQ